MDQPRTGAPASSPVAASTSGACSRRSPRPGVRRLAHQLVEPRRERSRAEALEDRARVVDGGLDDGVVGPQHERHVQDDERLLVDEPHLGQLREDRCVLSGRSFAIAVAHGERRVHRPALQVDDPTVHVGGARRSEARLHGVKIALPEQRSSGARVIRRCVRGVHLGGPSPGPRRLAIPSRGERHGGPRRQKVGLLLGVASLRDEALVLREQVVDGLASSGKDLRARAEDARTVRWSEVPDVRVVRGRQGPVPLAEVHGKLGGVADCGRVAAPEPEPARQVERRLAALEGTPWIATEECDAEVQQAADDRLPQAQRLGKPDARLEDPDALVRARTRRAMHPS